MTIFMNCNSLILKKLDNMRENLTLNTTLSAKKGFVGM